MKHILLVCLLSFAGGLYSQDNSETTLFAQCMLAIDSEQEMKELELSMRQHPNLKVVRLDYNTRRVFVLTRGLDQLNEAEFKSWFESYSEKVWCVQIGRHGVDEVHAYPFEGCGDKP
jgi:hypothetical protein